MRDMMQVGVWAGGRVGGWVLPVLCCAVLCRQREWGGSPRVC